MDIKVFSNPDQLNRKQWQNFILNNEHASVFQSPVMFEIYSKSPGFNPFIIVISEETSSIKGLLLGVIISDFGKILNSFTSRTVIYAGPVIDSEQENKKEIMDHLLTALISHVEGKSLIIEFRNFFDLSVYENIFIVKKFNYKPWSNIIVGSLSKQDFIKHFSNSKQRQVKKSLKNGAIVRPVSGINEIKELYRILCFLYKTKINKPLPSFEFFENIYSQGKDSGECIILVVVYKEKVVGGMVSMITPGKTIYEWYVCGMDKEYNEIHPSVLATWGAMEFASANDIKQFDFMGIGHPDEHYGVREFKMRFGGEKVSYGRYIRINNRLLFKIAKYGADLLVRLKWNLSF